MKGAQLLYRVRNRVRAPLLFFKILNRNKQKFECPICGYEGPFADFRNFGGFRAHAQCPRCGALERHRLQFVVMKKLLSDANFVKKKMLHFAPEAFFRPLFAAKFSKYETADLYMKDVDHCVDICELPFPDGSYDFVFASHVLEHIKEDAKAIKEVRRILAPGGVAVLPVPVVSEKTVEYPRPNPNEAGHVRAPGVDYFERYKLSFAKVTVHASGEFPEKHQLFVYEDRTRWPTKKCPLRSPMVGERHADFVPVCYV